MARKKRDPERERDSFDSDWDDRDDPLEQDMDAPDDDDDSPLEECPKCHREISGWAQRCPYCGNEALHMRGGFQPWVRHTGVAVLLILLIGTGLVTWLAAWIQRSLRG